MKRNLIVLTLALTLLPSFAAAAEKKWNPLTWIGDGHRALSSECGWMIGHPFALDGQQTQLALQVFTGSGVPYFLARFDNSDQSYLDRESEPGMILHLRNGAYRRTSYGSVPIVVADSHARRGWPPWPPVPWRSR